MHHHFAAGSLSRHNLVVFVFVFRARSNAITGHVLTLSRIKKRAREPTRGGREPPPRVDQTHASGGRPSWHDGRRGSVREVRGRKCGARSGFPFFFFFSGTKISRKLGDPTILQKSIPSPAHLRDQRKERMNAACTSHERIQQSQERDATDGLGVIRQIARTGVALGCGREIKRLRHTLPWRLLGTAVRRCCVGRNPRSSVFFTALSAGEVPDRSRDRHDA